MNMTYKDAGVDYAGGVDAFKVLAQAAALRTAANSDRLGYREYTASRGESVYLTECLDKDSNHFLAHVEEGLGTKNLVADVFALKVLADSLSEFLGKSYYDQIAQCAVAMIVNDMVTLGALPVSAAMHFAVEDASWFSDEARVRDLINGWEHACHRARCVWGLGETPVLKGVVVPGAAVLAGSAMGIVKPKSRLIDPARIAHGDAIVIVESSGIHANGLTLARKIAEKLPDGYLTKLSGGRIYGETLLDPTHIYVALVEDCSNSGVRIHYAVPVTGHGWRKLMRAAQPFTYMIDTLPTQLPIFDFIQKHGPVDDMEMYGTFNMGAGFALYVPEIDVEKVIAVAAHDGLRAFRAGHIENGPKKVIIEPKGLEYAGDTLAVR